MQRPSAPAPAPSALATKTATTAKSNPSPHSISIPASTIAYNLLNKVSGLEEELKLKEFTILQLQTEIKVLKEKLILYQATKHSQC